MAKELPEMMYGQILEAGAKPPGEAASIRSCLQAAHLPRCTPLLVSLQRQGKARQIQAKQSKADQSISKQSKAKQGKSKAMQIKAYQGKSKQGKVHSTISQLAEAEAVRVQSFQEEGEVG